MNKIGLYLIIFIFFTSGLALAEEVTLSLDEAVVFALRDNRDILLKAEEIEKAKAKIAEANAALFPTLNFTGTYSQNLGLYSTNLNQDSFQLTLREYLYKGGKIINTIEQNKQKLVVASALLDKAKLETVLKAKKAFLTLLLSQEFTKLNREILDNTGKHLDSLKERYKKGEASESDILRIESSFAAAKETFEATLSDVDAACELLRNLLYLGQEVSIKPKGEFIYSGRQIALSEAFLKALNERPEIKQYAAQEEADKKAIEIAKADARPSIYVSGDYYNRSHLSSSEARNRNDYAVAGITLSWPIFDGWLTKAKIAQAISDLNQTQLTKEKIIKDIALELRQAYLGLKDALAKIRSKSSELLFFKDNLSVIKQRYEEGLASSLDLEDTALKYNISLFNQKQAIYDYLLASADFEKASGESR